MVLRMEITYSEITDKLVTKYNAASPIGYTLLTGVYENSVLNLMLKSMLPHDGK